LPEQTLLYQVIAEELESFVTNARERGEPVARFVERELRTYLECGVLAHGFLRVHCDDCGHDRLVAFSCKGRGFCPSCGGRRMADTAAHLVDRVLPEVPVRQWVLTLPYPLRFRCAWDSRLTSDVLRAFLRALFADQRRRARQHLAIQTGRCASVTFIQRFGSALNLTPHFHSLVLDGVYQGPAHSLGPFLPLPPPTTEDVARVMAGTARRVMRLLEKRGLDRPDVSRASEDALLTTLMAASVRSRIATGQEAGQRWRRLGDRVEPLEPGLGDGQANSDPPARCVREGGMSLHADVSVPARDRNRLERLCRYVARPPLALERLESLENGLLSYRLKARWRDGTTHILMERRELLERLAPLIPPPRAHQVWYHGLLAPCASGRDQIVPNPSHDTARASLAPGHPPKNSYRQERHVGMERSGKGAGLPGTGEPASTTPSPLPESCETNSLSDDLALRQAGSSRLNEVKPARNSARPPRQPPNKRRLRWAELLKRVFELDALRCPICRGKMRVLAAITQPDVAARILECLALPARAPPIAAAAPAVGFISQPADEEGLEECPSLFDDFDQSPSDGWDTGA
jgi:hypothetical protein